MLKINEEVKDFAKEMDGIHIKRWKELPEFDLYATQIVDIIESELYFLKVFDREIITKSMINNYVKHEIIPRPQNKKYTRLAVACLMVVSILKQFMEISDIAQGIKLQTKILGTEAAYDKFCEEMERSIHLVFKNFIDGDYPMDIRIENVDIDSINLTLATMSIASKMLIKKLIEANGLLIKEG
ncbi:MAG: DUF1836 domain-containing protein [Tissierellia bacterium]|nr:DUF1836 domain-containing protein [Tissierellia bacterium]